MAKYAYSDKILLAKNIEKLTEKKDINEIKKIIFEYNPKLKVVKKTTCILMYFHDLNDSTYNVLDKYIKNRLLKECAKKIKNMNDLESGVSSEVCLSAGNTIKKNCSPTNQKYSTKEKNLIRRKKYENQLNFINGTEKETINFDDYNSNNEYGKSSQTPKNNKIHLVENSENSNDTNIFIKKI